MIKAIALLTPIYVTFFWGFVFLLQKGERNRPKLYLGLFMILGLLLYCTHAIYFYHLYNAYSYFESIYLFTMLSLYPLYYIYILLRTNIKTGLKAQYQHFLPAIVFATLSLLSTFFLSHEQRIFYVQDLLIDKNLRGINFSSLASSKGFLLFAARLCFLIQVIFYAVKGIIVVKQYNQSVADYYSNTEGKTLTWIRDLNIVILIVAAASISCTLIGRSYFSRHEVSLLLPSFIFSAILFKIGFKGNQQNETIEIVDLQHEEIKIENEETLKRRLVELFEKDMIYKHTDLRITNISEVLGTNRTYISRLINDDFGINFNEFVNQYRVKEAKQMLCCQNQNIYTMEHIAEKSGFGSTASFSRIFKEHENITPGRFRTHHCKKHTL